MRKSSPNELPNTNLTSLARAVRQARAPWWMVASSVAAGAAAAQEQEQIEEIVVRTQFFRPTEQSSATKFDLPVQDTPQAISVMTNDIFETYNTRDLIGIDKFVAGVNSSGNGANTNYFIGHIQARGFTLDQLSGYKINGFSTMREFQPDFVAVERVEFLKGPSSVVYGVNNYGGTINTVLKSPEIDSSYRLTADVGTYGTYRVSGDATGALTEDGSLRYRLASAWEDRQSQKDGFDYERLPVYARVQWDVTPRTTIDGYVLYQDEDTTDDFGYFAMQNANGQPEEPFGVDRDEMEGNADYNRIERESLQVFGSVRHEFANEWAVQGKVGFNETTHGYRAMYLYNYGYFNGPFVDVYTKFDDRNISSWDAELSFGGDFDMMGQTHKFMLLAEYRQIGFDFTEFPFDNIGNVNQFDPDFSGPTANLDPAILGTSNGARSEDQHRWALGGQVLWHLNDRLSALLGFRWDQIHQEVTDFKFDPDPTDSVFFAERNIESAARKRNVTPRAGLVYEVTPEINAYFSYSQGFLPQEGITRGGDAIDPEEGEQFEGGFKGEFLDGRLGASIVGFFIQREKVAIPDPTNSIPLQEDFRIQGGEQEHWGVEVEVIGEAFENLNVVATYAFLDTEITKEEQGLAFNDSSLGNSVIGAPEHSASLFLEYSFTGGMLRDVSINGGVHYVGERPSQQQNLVGEYPGFSPGFPLFYLEEYATFDLGLRYYGFENIVLSLQATNVFNEDYFNPAQLDADCCAANFLQRGTGREISGGISYEF
jgi:iron complex outermembrane receptor protein